MNNFKDYEYLRIVAKFFESFKECPKHGKIDEEINKIADKLEALEKECSK